MNQEQGREFVTQLYKQVWERADKNRIPHFFSKELSGFVGLEPLTLSTIYEAIDYIQKNYSEVHYMVHDVVVSDHKIAAVINSKSFNKHTQEERYTSNAVFLELTQNKIYKFRLFFGVPQAVAPQTVAVAPPEPIKEIVAESPPARPEKKEQSPKREVQSSDVQAQSYAVGQYQFSYKIAQPDDVSVKLKGTRHKKTKDRP